MQSMGNAPESIEQQMWRFKEPAASIIWINETWMHGHLFEHLEFQGVEISTKSRIYYCEHPIDLFH